MSNPRWLLVALWATMLSLLVACESDNEHFCARYDYVYSQLLDDDELPSYGEMRAQLVLDMSDPKKDKQQAKFMLFVLDDWQSELVQPGETPRESCMRIERWQQYL